MSSLPSLYADTSNRPSKLLVIDDEPAVLKLVKVMLNRANYNVITCTSAIDALNLLNSEDVFDCIITDAIMPSMSGYDLVKAVRQHPTLADLPILMLTRKRHRQDVKMAVEIGVSDYVLKPIDEHLLLDKVELCLKKSTNKRHVVELSLGGNRVKADIDLECEVVSISESELTIKVPFLLSTEVKFNLKTSIFEEIGITMPYLKLRSSELTNGASDEKTLRYQAKLMFVGVPEQDLMKIRSWIQREMIRRKK